MEAVGAQVAAMLRAGGHLIVNAATIAGSEPTPLADDLADRFSRHLVRHPDLPIAWDEPPEGITDNRCLVFAKPAV